MTNLQNDIKNTADVDRGVCVCAGVEVINISTECMASNTSSAPDSMSGTAENMIESLFDERSRPPSVLGVSTQAGAETGYRQEYRDRSDNNTLTREVVKVDDFPGPSGVCATEYLTVSSSISKRRIFKK